MSKHPIFIVVTVLQGYFIQAQNIVYNGGFEEIYEICCDSANGQMCATPWSASAGSPDHFRGCGEGSHSIPQNILGHQFAHNGSAYAGFVTIALPTFANTREIPAQIMKYDLTAGEEYYFECWVSPADHYRRICHNIGVTFTLGGELLDCEVDCPVYLENDSSNPIDNKEIWTKVSGTFVADGGERIIHIGNFRPDSLSEMEWVDDGSTDTLDWWDYAYYYIDDIWLSHVDSMGYVGFESLSHPLKGPELKLWPNPTRDVVSIKLQGSTLRQAQGDGLHLSVMDMMGREICKDRDCHGRSSLAMTGATELDVSDLPPGVYLLEVLTDDGNTIVEKFVKHGN
ncbi:MAG: hypothetical protein ACI85F_002515 [Bacteroidia bacterium]|jgi:hypothetical protein